MQIRSAKKEDYKQLLKLLYQLNPDDPFSSELARKPFEEILAAKNLHILVAEENGALLANWLSISVPYGQ